MTKNCLICLTVTKSVAGGVGKSTGIFLRFYRFSIFLTKLLDTNLKIYLGGLTRCPSRFLSSFYQILTGQFSRIFDRF